MAGLEWLENGPWPSLQFYQELFQYDFLGLRGNVVYEQWILDPLPADVRHWSDRRALLYCRLTRSACANYYNRDHSRLCSYTNTYFLRLWIQQTLLKLNWSSIRSLRGCLPLLDTRCSTQRPRKPLRASHFRQPMVADMLGYSYSLALC